MCRLWGLEHWVLAGDSCFEAYIGIGPRALGD